jgi:hypothetical protein
VRVVGEHGWVDVADLGADDPVGDTGLAECGDGGVARVVEAELGEAGGLSDLGVGAVKAFERLVRVAVIEQEVIGLRAVFPESCVHPA